jgi:hypothetical protein
MAAADGHRGSTDEAAAPEAWPLLRALVGSRRPSNVWSITVRSGSSVSHPGDHSEGQFEGQNGASESQSELAAASVS